MAYYPKMYYSLFNDLTDVINMLQAAQRKTEDIFIDSDSSTAKYIKKPDSNVVFMKIPERDDNRVSETSDISDIELFRND